MVEIGKYVSKKHVFDENVYCENGKDWVVEYVHPFWGDVYVGHFSTEEMANEYVSKCEAREKGYGLEFVLRWFNAVDDEMVDEEYLNLTPEEAHKIVEERPFDPPIMVYTVSAGDKLMITCDHEIDLNKYDYFLECEVDYAKHL